jgi:Ca2+-binding RTX toxin-like protein
MANANETQLLYILYFGRPGEPAGLSFWSTGAGLALPLNQVADEFAKTDEFKALAAIPDVSVSINSFYRNLFGANADPGGLLFWTNAVNTNVLTLQQVGLEIAKAALALPDGSARKVSIQAKVEAANRWSNSVALSPISQQQYGGTLANTFGVDFLVPVTTIATIPSLIATQAAVNGLPPVGTVGLLSSNASSVSEGGTVIFQIQTIPDLAGQTVAYQLTGIQAADVVGGSLSGNVLISATGVGLIQVNLAQDGVVDPGETLKIVFPNKIIFDKPPGSSSIVVIDTTVPVVPVLSVSPQPSAVNEGSILTFVINSANVAPGSILSYNVVGISSADVNGALLSGTRTVNADGTVNPVVFQVSADLLTEGAETAVITVSGGGAASASTSAVINDTSTTPVLPTQVVLTPQQDILAASAVPNFTFFGNEDTLGQNDQLNGTAAVTTVLNIGTQGSFDISNFSTTNVDILKITPAGESLLDNGAIDLQASTGLTKIEVNQSKLGALRFNDIQSVAGLSATLTDSFSDFFFNVDASALTGGNDTFLVEFSEAPIDALTGEALGIIVNQGPINSPAALENLGLTSSGSTTNVLDKLQVGPALTNLVINGSRSLEVLPDIGAGGQGNTNIRMINAAGLNGNLTGGPGPNDFFTYTSAVSGGTVNGTDVTVLGATGVNQLSLQSVTAIPTDFLVITQDSSDKLITGNGNDVITTAGGNDTVNAGNGNNTVSGGTGSDSIVTGNGNDSVDAGNGNNFVAVDGGNDTVLAAEGNDTVDLGAGNDFADLGDGNNSVSTGTGNNTVIVGTGNDTVLLSTGNDSLNTGAGNDLIVVDKDELTDFDSINGGTGIDTIRLVGSGTLLASETDLVSQIEVLQIVGTSIIDPIFLDDELVRTSDDLTTIDGIGVRRFTVQNLTANFDASSITLNISAISSNDGAGNRTNIRYLGQSDNDLERVIVTDVQLNRFTQLQFGEGSGNEQVDTLQIINAIDATADDFNLVSGLDRIELTATQFGQVFNIQFDAARFDSLTGGGLLTIAATPSLQGAVLNLDVSNLSAAQASRITIQGSAQLTVSPIAGANAGSVNLIDALFYTPNQDNIVTLGGNQTVIAFQLSDVQTADFVDLGGNTDTAEFRFGLANTAASLATQLQNTAIINTEIFTFLPTNFNQPVRFTALGAGFAPQLATINTANGADALLNIERNILVVTGGGNDTVSSDAATGNAIRVDSGEGNDSITTFGGSDFINAGEGNNTVGAGNGNNTVSAGAGNDSIVTGTGSDSVNAGDGDNFVSVDGGNNTVFTGLGSDTIDSGDGNDRISSGDGNDSVRTGAGADSVDLGAGNDFLFISANGAPTVVNSPVYTDNRFSPFGAEEYDYSGGSDTVAGGTGNDILSFDLLTNAVAVQDFNGINLTDVETFNISGDGAATLRIANQVAIQAGGTVTVNYLDNVAGTDGVDARPFVAGTSLRLNLASQVDNDITTVEAGAGADIIRAGNIGGALGRFEIAGNGGSDTINLSTFANRVDTIVFNTAADGGPTGDLITGFQVGTDRISIRGAFQANLGGPANDNDAITNGQGRFGDFGINLTQPFIGLTDGQIGNAAIVAGAINSVGGAQSPFANSDDQMLIYVQGQTDTAIWVWTETDPLFAFGGTFSAQANELKLLATFDNTLLTNTSVI